MSSTSRLHQMQQWAEVAKRDQPWLPSCLMFVCPLSVFSPHRPPLHDDTHEYACAHMPPPPDLKLARPSPGCRLSWLVMSNQRNHQAVAEIGIIGRITESATFRRQGSWPAELALLPSALQRGTPYNIIASSATFAARLESIRCRGHSSCQSPALTTL